MRTLRESTLSLAMTVIKEKLEAWRDFHKLQLARCTPDMEAQLKNKIDNYQMLIDIADAALRIQ